MKAVPCACIWHVANTPRPARTIAVLPWFTPTDLKSSRDKSGSPAQRELGEIMNLPTQPNAEIIDHFLHGLLDDAQIREIERRISDDPTWASAADSGKRRRAALEAALPPTEPA